jgi:hypothetical protein
MTRARQQQHLEDRVPALGDRRRVHARNDARGRSAPKGVLLQVTQLVRERALA